MEHYRRLGFAERDQSPGLPPEFPTDVAYYTRFSRHELARFNLPSARAAKQRVADPAGSWSTPNFRTAYRNVRGTSSPRGMLNLLLEYRVHYGWRRGRLPRRKEITWVVEVAEVADRWTPNASRQPILQLAMVRGALFGRGLAFPPMQEKPAITRDFFGGRMLALYSADAKFLPRSSACARMDECHV